MKTIRSLVLVTLVAISPVAFAAANDVDQRIQALRTEFEKYLEALPKTSEQRTRYGADAGAYMQNMLMRVANESKQGNYESVDQQLRQLGLQMPTPAAARLVTEWLADNQAARELRDNTWAENVDALVTRAGPILLAAKNEKELDALLKESSSLRAVQNNRGGQNDHLQRTAQKFESLSYFVRRWQDYLAQLNAGNIPAARQAMQELANDSRYPIIPRSELLARLTAPPLRQVSPESEKNAGPYPFQIASLDELPAALDRMRRHYSGKTMPPEEQVLFNNLSSLANALAAAETGNLQPAFYVYAEGIAGGQIVGVNVGSTASVMDARRMLLRSMMFKVLPRFLDIKAEPAANSDESATDYCLRIARTARDANNWPLVARTLEAYERLAFQRGQPSAWLATDRAALTLYLIGLNQEKAGDLEAAFVSYQGTLTSQGAFVPIDDIAARINRLRKVIRDRQETEQKRQADLMRKQQ